MSASDDTPSLFGDTQPFPKARPADAADGTTLLDLMYDGFYLLFLLRGKNPPVDADAFRDNVRQFLTDFERGCSRLDTPSENVYRAKYAFCALLDETILQSSFKIRDEWERRPLQLQFFGDQLAGENFFLRLEKLRSDARANLQVLEIFHMCLLLGFKGKYLLEGEEKLGYLTARLGDEIAHLKGKRAGFAPHWQAPDRVSHALRHEVPVWAIASVFAFLGVAAFVGLRWHLDRGTAQDLASYTQVIKLPPKVAHVTISLP